MAEHCNPVSSEYEPDTETGRFNCLPMVDCLVGFEQ